MATKSQGLLQLQHLLKQRLHNSHQHHYILTLDICWLMQTNCAKLNITVLHSAAVRSVFCQIMPSFLTSTVDRDNTDKHSKDQMDFGNRMLRQIT